MKMIRAMQVVAAAVAGVASAAALAQAVVVGGKNFTEQQIMAAMTSQLLAAKGFKPEVKAGMGSAVLRQAQESGQIDVYWEYTGTGLGVFNKITDKFASSEDAYKRIKEVDAAKGIVWLAMSPVNNTYAFAMNRDDAACVARGYWGCPSTTELTTFWASGLTSTASATDVAAATGSGHKPIHDWSSMSNAAPCILHTQSISVFSFMC